MAKTVDQFSTIEDFRTTFNEVSNDVGDKSGLRTDQTGDLVDAINSVEDKVFFFQEYIYTATNGQTLFTGNDIYNNSLLFRQDRIQVFQIDVSESPDASQLLIEGTHYTIGGLVGVNYNELTLISGAGVGDKLLIYSFTGSYLGTGAGGAGLAGHWTETVANTIFSNNPSGVIINADGDNKTTALTSSSYPIEFAGGKVYSQDDMLFAATKKVTATGGFVGNVKATNDAIILNSQNGTATATFLGDVTGNIVGATADMSGQVSGSTLTDDVLTINAGSITDAVNGTFSGYLDIEGNIDVNGISNLDVVDIDGAVDMASTLDVTGAITGSSTVSGTSFTGKLIGDVYADNGTTKVLENSTGVLTGSVSGQSGTTASISGHSTAGLSNVTGLTQDIIVSNPITGHVLSYTNAGTWVNSVGAVTYEDTDARNAMIRSAGDHQDGNFGLRFEVNGGQSEARLDYEEVSSAPTEVGSTREGHLWFVI